MQAHNARHPESEHGFTLIELMVTVLILGVLISIALPTFMGARARAEERSAHVKLKESFTAAKVYFVDGDTFTGLDDVQLQAIAPELQANLVPAPGASPDEVSIRVANGRSLMLVTQAADGYYFCIAEDTTGIFRGAHASTDAFATVADCSGATQTW